MSFSLFPLIGRKRGTVKFIEDYTDPDGHAYWIYGIQVGRKYFAGALPKIEHQGVETLRPRKDSLVEIHLGEQMG